MDEFETYSYDYSEPGSSSESDSPPPPQTPSLPKITLKLPALKPSKPAKSHKKSKSKKSSASTTNYGSPALYDTVEYAAPKAQRPVKLKPLKEVLSKLIAQIKKKDEYAIFLEPVNTALVPGYTDAIKHPMDFGTMTTKVERGRYRSLEEFANDFKLVTTNAKTFNPPNTIYHTEADRIEAYGLDHISKAAGTVVQYETDWNIDVEKDEDPLDVEEDEGGTAMDVDEPSQRSYTPQASTPAPATSSGRRGPRGPYKKHAPAPEKTVDEDGRLPGAKDGLAAFPPGSDWAKVMLQLKLKNKRYRTKKERMRVEKEGLPVLPDGSLDYWEIEEPFYMLQQLVPDPMTRPQLIPLYPPVSMTTPSSSSTSHYPQESRENSYDPNRGQSVQPQGPAAPNLPLPTTLPPSHIRDVDAYDPPRVLGKRRHWTITRNVSSRWRGDRDEAEEEDPPWKVPREAHTTDFGSLAVLASEIEAEMQRRNVQPRSVNDPNEEERLFMETLKETLEPDPAKVSKVMHATGSIREPEEDEMGPRMMQHEAMFFTPTMAVEAEEYLRDVVYGGVAGYAYVRSLAQFVSGRDVVLDDEDEDYAMDTSDGSPHSHPLGMPLAHYIERTILDPCTDARHALLRRTAALLATFPRDRWVVMMRKYKPNLAKTGAFADDVVRQIGIALCAFPNACKAFSQLRGMWGEAIDQSLLARAPGDLEACEREWAGAVGVGAMNGTGNGQAQGEGASGKQPPRIQDVLNFVLQRITEAAQKAKEGAGKKEGEAATAAAAAPSSAMGAQEETPEMRTIRMNLLALTKRMPGYVQQPLNFSVPLSPATVMPPATAPAPGAPST
ncbi:hypothetical protein EV715DRAFT_288308 [Schizophyllum commune]